MITTTTGDVMSDASNLSIYGLRTAIFGLILHVEYVKPSQIELLRDRYEYELLLDFRS